jgi:hypothetical protein
MEKKGFLVPPDKHLAAMEEEDLAFLYLEA